MAQLFGRVACANAPDVAVAASAIANAMILSILGNGRETAWFLRPLGATRHGSSADIGDARIRGNDGGGLGGWQERDKAAPIYGNWTH